MSANHTHRTTATSTTERTPAKVERKPIDRRKDHPAPLTDADRETIAAMPYIAADACDLDQIPPRYRTRALAFLRAFADGAHTKDAMHKAEMVAWEWHYCKHYSNTFRNTYETLATAHRDYATAVMEDTLADLATGNFKPREGYAPPEVRAASVLLPAFDAKYRTNGGTAQQVQINIAI